MITWGDVVEIIIHVFEINQTQLAGSIRHDKAVITRIKTGKQIPSSTEEQLFSSIFDPATDKSLASKGKRDSQYLLNKVKKEIESNFKEVQEDMKDYWEEKDYRTFILVLLERAEQGPPSTKQQRLSGDSGGLTVASDAINNVSTDNSPTEAGTPHSSKNKLPVRRRFEVRQPQQPEKMAVQSADATGARMPFTSDSKNDVSDGGDCIADSSKEEVMVASHPNTDVSDIHQMRQIFTRVQRECHILDFIGAELFPGIDTKLLTWADRFIKTIRINLLGAFEYKQMDPLYISIKCYCDTLDEYKRYLEENTYIWERDIPRLVPKGNDDYKETVSFYRKRLLSLSHAILLDIIQ